MRPLSTLRDALGKLEAELASGGGPFLGGATFGLADAAYAPFFRRWRAAETWAPEARLLADRPAAAAWSDALLARRSVRAAEPADFARRVRRTFEERAAKARQAS